MCDPSSSSVRVETTSPAVSLEFQAHPKLESSLIVCLTCRAWGQSQFWPMCCAVRMPSNSNTTVGGRENKAQSYICALTPVCVWPSFSLQRQCFRTCIKGACVSIICQPGREKRQQGQQNISLITALRLQSASHAALGRVAMMLLA